MHAVRKKSSSNSNYSFLLNCMAAFAAATMGAYSCAFLAAQSAGVKTGLVAATTTASPIAAIFAVAVAALIVATCILPFLLGSSNPAGLSYGYSSFGLYPRPGYVYYPRSTGAFGGVMPGHRSNFFSGGTVHTHGAGSFGSGGAVHHHEGGSHGGGVVHSHEAPRAHGGSMVHIHGMC